MKLHEVHWEVTNKCNLRCKHCLPSSGEPRTNELSTEGAIAALEEFHSTGVDQIYFTGGEPFARSDFLTLLQRAIDLGMRVVIITNATLLTEEVLKIIRKYKISLGISLDGANTKTNDIIRGKDTFTEVVKTLQKCRVAGITVTLYVTVTRLNFDQLQDLGLLANGYSCKGIHFNEVTLAGRAVKFTRDLELSEAQQRRLPETVAAVVRDVYGEWLLSPDKQCWVDGSSLYMTADGNLYLCSEVFQRSPDLVVGNIRSFNFKKWLDIPTALYDYREYRCCYSVQASDHVTLISNTRAVCALSSDKPSKIETLDQLYQKLDELYHDIELDCFECQDPDCMGYVWLLEQEASQLYECGVPLVQINNGPTFIHSFPTAPDGKIKVSEKYPPCSQLCTNSRRCSIYKDRPLVCRLYPLGLETTKEGKSVWALHRDCLYIRRMEERGLLPNFETRALQIINHLSPQLLAEIVASYRAVDVISAFPDGENNYSILKESIVSKCKAILDSEKITEIRVKTKTQKSVTKEESKVKKADSSKPTTVPTSE